MKAGNTLAALIVGVVLGAAGIWLWLRPAGVDTAVPASWVARVGDSYISEERYRAEMARRGGGIPGQFHEERQKLALLDELVYQQALVERARRDGIDQQPEVRRSIDQILASQVLRRDLREEQEKVQVSDAMVRAFYDANVDSYRIPERRRIAIVRIGLPPDASEERWTEAGKRLAEAREGALALDAGVRHFGDVARS